MAIRPRNGATEDQIVHEIAELMHSMLQADDRIRNSWGVVFDTNTGSVTVAGQDSLEMDHETFAFGPEYIVQKYWRSELERALSEESRLLACVNSGHVDYPGTIELEIQPWIGEPSHFDYIGLKKAGTKTVLAYDLARSRLNQGGSDLDVKVLAQIKGVPIIADADIHGPVSQVMTRWAQDTSNHFRELR